MHGIVFLFSFNWNARFQAPPSTDKWLSPDKAQHFLMSAFVQSAAFSAIRLTKASRSQSLAGATVVSASVGIGKELYDKKFGGDPSWKDLVADGAGIGAASILLHQTPK